jgi:hypothetical protein
MIAKVKAIIIGFVNTYDQEANYTSSNLTFPSFSAAEERPRMIIFQQQIITTSSDFCVIRGGDI